MPPEVRRASLLVAAALVVVAVCWASLFETLEPAEFSLQNGTDPKTLDPARATGNIEGRLLNALFEGLLRMTPEGEPDPETGLQPMTAQPGMAESYEVSDDGRTYTFHLRAGARWTDGTPVTSHDFAFSWLRMLHPETASEFSYHLYGLPHAEAYNKMIVHEGDRVEVELWDRPGDTPEGESNGQLFPRGTMLYGVVERIEKEPKPEFPEPMPEDPHEAELEQNRRDNLMADWRERWVYHVRVIEPEDSGKIDWDAEGTLQSFTTNLDSSLADDSTRRCHWVLVALSKMDVMETPDEKTFVVHLREPIPYFPNVAAFYPTYPVNRACVEQHGAPLWTKAENIVTNGPYKLQFRRLRDRLRVVKNEDYHAADITGFKTVDFLSVEKATTAMNMYETGQIQWATNPPATLLDVLKERDDFYSAPQLSVYFYRFNVDVPPLDDVRVRRAITMAINRQEIVDKVTRAGEKPAHTFVPPGLAGYESPDGFEHDIAEARRLLAEAGYPGGRGMPKITVLYNTNESHRDIAEVVQQQLRNTLNIPIALENMEWGTFLDKTSSQDYQVARAGWIADYPDPNTFLNMWVTDGAQNNTGWSNERYDELIEQAAAEDDPQRRMEIFREAEEILMTELPIAPFYFYTSKNMVKPNVQGFFPTAQDIHPLHLMRYRNDSASAADQQ